MRRLALVLLAACGGPATGPTATIIAMAGDVADPSASVVTSRANGELIDSIGVDAAGEAHVQVEPGALVTVTFAGVMLTTVAPAAEGELVVVGPPQPSPPLVAGAVAIMPPPITADDFEIELGCTTAHVPALPQTIGVPAACLGTDSNLDVLVRAFAQQDLVGYTAARLSLLDVAAQLAPAQWDTLPPALPVTLEPGITADAVLLSDGQPFAPALVGDHVTTWTGLTIDGIRLHAFLAGRATTVAFASPPDAIHLGADDFLPPYDPQPVADDAAHFHWNPPPLGDAVDLQLAWPGLPVWHVVLPPDATAVALPALASPTGVLTSELHVVDSTELDGFAALVASGVHVEDPAHPTIAVPPRTGELRRSP